MIEDKSRAVMRPRKKVVFISGLANDVDECAVIAHSKLALILFVARVACSVGAMAVEFVEYAYSTCLTHLQLAQAILATACRALLLEEHLAGLRRLIRISGRVVSIGILVHL
jgi:hypothetical protein